MVFVFAVRLQSDYTEKQSERGWHHRQKIGVAFGFMLGPVRTLAVLAAVVRELAFAAGSKIHDLDVAFRIRRVQLGFGFFRACFSLGVCSLETPAAVLANHLFVDYCQDRLNLHYDLSILDGRLVRHFEVSLHAVNSFKHFFAI